jgi:hypothetical protein
MTWGCSSNAFDDDNWTEMLWAVMHQLTVPESRPSKDYSRPINRKTSCNYYVE